MTLTREEVERVELDVALVQPVEGELRAFSARVLAVARRVVAQRAVFPHERADEQ